MHSILLLGFLATASAATLPPTLSPRQVVITPDNTCGTTSPGGSPAGFRCFSNLPCCSSFGFCGATDVYCLSTTGCQEGFSFSAGSPACYAPKNGTTLSPDGTCGSTGAGKWGYRCREGECCSRYGYCGASAAFCAAEVGCQSNYGKCNAPISTTSAAPSPVPTTTTAPVPTTPVATTTPVAP